MQAPGFVATLGSLLFISAGACAPPPPEAAPPGSEVEAIDQAVTAGGKCKGNATACLNNHTLAVCKNGRFQKVPCSDRCFPNWSHSGVARCDSCVGGGQPEPCSCPAFEDQIGTACSAITGIDEQQACGRQCVGGVCLDESGRNEPRPFWCKAF